MLHETRLRLGYICIGSARTPYRCWERSAVRYGLCRTCTNTVRRGLDARIFTDQYYKLVKSGYNIEMARQVLDDCIFSPTDYIGTLLDEWAKHILASGTVEVVNCVMKR